MLGLVVAILIASPAARAQQPPPDQKPAASEALPDLLIEGVRSLFRSIFGGSDTPAPAKPAQPEVQPAPPSAPQPAPQSSSPPPALAEPGAPP